MPLSGWTRRHKLTHGKEKEEWDGNFRQPPKPDSYYISQKGICRWCGEKIIENNGARNWAHTGHETLHLLPLLHEWKQWRREGPVLIVPDLFTKTSHSNKV